MAEATGGARPRPLLDVAGAVLASVLAFAAVPAALLLVVGDPLTTGMGHAWSPVPRTALCVLTLAAWVAWGACCAQLVRAVLAHVRRGAAPSTTGGTLVERVAARIAVGVLALMGLGSPGVLASSAGASAPRAASVPHGAVLPVAAPPGVGEAVTALGAARHEVRPGDTLWRVADALLDDGADWVSIARLNFGRVMSDGTRLVDPDQLRAGWDLVLPTRRPDHRSTEASAVHRGAVAAARPSGGPPRPGRHLPELVALGLGSLTCAALARRAARRRGQPFTDAALPPVSEAALDAAALVQRFAGVPALGAFETANVMLARALENRSAGDPKRSPVVRAVCVGPTGVSFELAEPDAEAPDGFSARPDGTAWLVAHEMLEADPEAASSPPYLPLVLPVGDDEAGTWLLGLQPGTVVPVLGESASALCRAARTALSAWAWADTVLVSDDPDDPALRREAETDPLVARHLVFFGDPGALSPPLARRTAVVTTAPVAASDLSVLVDRHAATLHPLGRVLRPHLLDADTASALEELGGTTGRTAAPRRSDRRHTRQPDPRTRSGPVPRAAPVGPGPVEVRLLTRTPRLDGLCEELPPNRARRAVELVAYLALQQPDIVTSDRLRTRVLGSADADAAAKTLFNTAHAARRAMGTGRDGELLFPPAGRNGLYRLSPEVSTDVGRASAFAAEGLRHAETDPDLALAHLRAALELVEGEPLANVLAGYSWWEAEGHGARLSAVMVQAACLLAGLAVDRDHVALAWWGLGQARLVAPYSEALARTAMRTAAAEGDAERLRTEWRDCRRMVDALDPGSAPSSRTETLYGELSRRLAGVSGGSPEPGGS